MKLEELRRNYLALVQEARDIQKRAEGENRNLTETEVSDIDSKLTQADNMRADIDRLSKLEGHEDFLGQRQNDPLQNEPGSGGKNDGPFRNFGEFMREVRFNPNSPELREFQMSDGSAGGILVPEQFSSELLKVNPEAAIVRPRARVIPAGSPPDSKITFPALEQGAAGVYGGIEVVWTAEGGAVNETDAKLEEVGVEPQEVSAYVTVSDKLLRNASAASSFIAGLLRDGLNGAEDYAFLRGDGAGKPLGVINSPGKLNAKRDTASSVKYADLAAMLGKLLPESLGRAIWVANQTVLPELMTLQDPANRYIFVQGDQTKGVPASLLGFPIMFTGKTPVLGSEGDLMLVDFGYYIIKDGSGPFVAASEHVNFKNNKTVIKIVKNVDGQGWMKAPLTLEDKKTKVSPVVILK